ncbi:uncharacterized protein LOC129272286 [Lytechinus pictus]|uniref:uncharacterized protein LOC129272286 n=1 Tax=Lytechinus pictus TaxID=7653 RepID=UPI00240D7C5C|nr:uncharacterized protein LOC129272286 [Lytechinus pictus]
MSVDLAVASDPQNKAKDDNPYADYMWMGEEEQEFEQDVLAQLEEEEYLEYCFQDMMEEEALGLFIPPPIILPSSLTSTGTTTTMPLIENLTISNANGGENGHHGNGDVILQPASNVGAGGDANYESAWQSSEDEVSGDKHDNLTDSDSSEGCPQR